MANGLVRIDGAFVRDEDGSFEGTAIRFVRRDGRDALPALRVARDRARAALPDVVGFWGPAPLPGGAAVLSIQWWDLADDLRGLLEVLARALGDQGASGVLDRFEQQAAPAFESDHRETMHGMAGVLAPRLRPDALERALARGDGPVALDDVEPEVLVACLERALDWCVVLGGRHYAQYATASYEVRPGERGDLLRRSLSADDVAEFTCERWPEERRSVRFASPARLVLELGRRDPVQDRRPLLAAAEALLRDFAGLVDWAFVLPSTGRTSELLGPLRRTRSAPPAGESNWYWTRHLEHRRVPDVFVAQLLGPGHEEAHLPAERWTVRDVGRQRLVTARDAVPWLVDGRLGDDVLAPARADFSPLLLTAEEDAAQRSLFLP